MAHLIPTSRHTEAQWRNESTQKPPKNAVYLHETNAAAVLEAARNHTATVWTGDFHNAKQILAAMKKRIRGKNPKAAAPDSAADIQTAFHVHRMRQAQQSRLLNMLAVEIGVGFTLDLPRAPDVRAALSDVYGNDNSEPFLFPLNQLIGFIGAYEWHKKGIDIPALDGRIHVPFGVFSPIRGEYLDLLAAAPLSKNFQTAFDIGTGSGVIAALLAKRGIARITATDTNPRALVCAHANLARLGCADRIGLLETDLFPEGRADLIVCNPPWLPAKPTSAVETALYDPGHSMLKAFLHGAAAHLKQDGEIWLIMSDLAEHLCLRQKDELAQMFQTASNNGKRLEIIDTLHTKPKHGKALDQSDPLAFARNRETTFLYRLKAV